MNAFESLLNSSIDLLFARIPQPQPNSTELGSVRLVAHRGIHESGLARENTLSAFRLACDHKIWGIELDVRWSKDFEPIIHHDADTRRLYGKNINLNRTNYSVLKSEIPDLATLKEVVIELGKKIHLMIELKGDILDGNFAIKLAKLNEILSGLEPDKDYHILSMQPEIFEKINFVPRSAFMDVVWLNPTKIFKQNEHFGNGAVCGHFVFFSQRRINKLHRAQKKIGVGFIASRNSFYREIHRGVDFIFTNCPLRLQSLQFSD